MKTLVFFNNKGGVGKTTLTCNVVSYLNLHKGKRVLLIDADPQCNASQLMLADDVIESLYLSKKVKSPTTLYTHLRPLEQGDAAVSSTLRPILASQNAFATDLIPCHPNMALIEDRLSQAWADLRGGDEIRGYRISNWVSQLLEKSAAKYDLVVFDVGPSLGAINRTILLSSDFVITPFGSDIFSLVGIQNIASWMEAWQREYARALQFLKERHADAIAEYPGVSEASRKTRLAGYSVQQYVTKTFKTGRRPVKAYDDIMKMIPSTVVENLSSYFPTGLNEPDLVLGHIPFLYSLVPLAQANRSPIHRLGDTKKLTGAQVRQVADYSGLMDRFCDRLLANVGI
ncbi:ParA family protein [Bradyrhizobium erythrophlei]|uniref:AAA domain-containing protein n=1 Tax=Bradyrhizobium erythrophlei TaxID=1437360 RepID=A0A1H4P2L7_9BRAD|nr:ParA family protein [Bradyrhizobium erythrophlei]SEC01162.1 AAA domain-containing protein [Bradyrhizobium erythrophlei]